MHRKGEFAIIKGSIWNIPIEAANICNILPRPADSNGLTVMKLKQDLKGCVRFIFTSLFCMSKREDLWNSEKCYSNFKFSNI